MGWMVKGKNKGREATHPCGSSDRGEGGTSGREWGEGGGRDSRQGRGRVGSEGRGGRRAGG